MVGITRLDYGARFLVRGAATVVAPAARTSSVYTILVLLTLSTVASMGGQGGGGILAPTFMMFDGLDPHEAVPLSKVVVFIGTLASCMVHANSDKDLVDAEVVFALIPTALAGTLIGVHLNRIAQSELIVSLLTATLLITLYIITNRLREQMKEEEQARDAAVTAEADAAGGMKGDESVFSKPQREALRVKESFRTALLLVGVLITVILCGALMQLMMECGDTLNLKSPDTPESPCQHGILRSIFGKSHDSADGFLRGSWGLFYSVAPALVALAAAGGVFFHVFVQGVIGERGTWTRNQLMSFSGMGFIAGCLAALIGIGGGMTFAPFMLFMGMEPAAVVATSTFCVLFTSCSTSMQYMLLGRVVLELVPIYAIANVIAAVTGSWIVHHLHQSKQPKYMITVCVLIAQIASAIFCIFKLVKLTRDVHDPAILLDA